MTTSSRRTRFGLGLPEALCLFAYSAIVLCLIRYHEPWTDEAQGWLIANSSSLKTIFGRVLHYEVAPPLWQLALWPLVKLHLSFRSANWLSASLGIFSAYLVLRFAPFPRIARCLLPFTFFLQYQYAVIARPYAFFPLLLFVLCVLFRKGQSRSLLFVLVAGLLANINLHCTLYAVFLFAACVLGRKGSLHGASIQNSFFTRVQKPAVLVGVFCAALLLVVAVAFPAPDQYMSGPLQRLKTITSRLIPPEHPADSLSPDPPEISTEAAPARMSRSVARLVGHAFEVGQHTLASMFYPVSQYNVVAAAFLLLCVLWLVQLRQVLMLLPLAGMAMAYYILPTAGYHTGLFFIAILGSLWMAWPAGETSSHSRLYLAFAAACAIVVLLQINWSARAAVADFQGDYDPSAATAHYLEASFPNSRIAAFSYPTETLQLYAPFRPLGWQHPFWTWSQATDPNSYKTSILAMRPDVVVTGTALAAHTIEGQFGKQVDGTPVGKNVTKWWEDRGWRVTRRFCGHHFGFGSYESEVCLSVLLPPAK